MLWASNSRSEALVSIRERKEDEKGRDGKQKNLQVSLSRDKPVEFGLQLNATKALPSSGSSCGSTGALSCISCALMKNGLSFFAFQAVYIKNNVDGT
jgi:hypothetical protein